MKRLNGKQCLVLGAETVILLALLFCKWVGVEMLFFTRKTTLLRLGSVLGDLHQYIGGVFPTLLAVFVYGGLTISAVALIRAALGVVSERGQDEATWKSCGLCVPAIFSCVTVLLVIIVNAVVKERTDGLVQSLLGLTATPFLVVILSVFAAVVNQKVVTDPASLVNGEEEDPKTSAEENPMRCVACGAKHSPTALFCGQCGTKLQQEATNDSAETPEKH